LLVIFQTRTHAFNMRMAFILWSSYPSDSWDHRYVSPAQFVCWDGASLTFCSG
jgi:hypothetical protein